MRSVVLMIGLASVCLLHADNNIPVQPDFAFKKMAGKWYPIATTKVLVPERPVYAYTMQPLGKGDLVLKVEMPKEDTCKTKRVVLHTLRAGVFTTADDKFQAYLVETDYDTYHIILFTKEEEGEKDLFLYAKEEEVSDEVKEKFKNRVNELSFDPEAITYLPRTRAPDLGKVILLLADEDPHVSNRVASFALVARMIGANYMESSTS